MNISEEVEKIYPFLVSTRRYLHEHPESSLKEYETSKFIKQELDKINIDYVTVGETGVLAEIKGKNAGKTIFLRADMDALEMNDAKDADYKSKNQGLNHACGHDAHTAALLGATKILATKKDKLNGNIKIAFQPAEEIGAGARLFVRAGYLKGVDLAFGLHVSSELETGKLKITDGAVSASCDIFTINVDGQSAHASTPQLGKDAALATASILVELQSLISRQKSPFTPAVISIGVIEAGTRYNVIAAKGKIQGTLRTLEKYLRTKLLNKIEKVAKNVAQIHDCTATFENYDAASVLVNDKNATRFVTDVANKIVGDENILNNSVSSLGAEDFADYSEVCPSCFAYVGTNNGEKTSYPAHSEKFDIDEEALKIACQFHINVALEYLK